MFTRPGLLWLLLLFPVLGLFWTYARWARRRLLARVGNRFRIERLVQVRRGRRWLMQTSLGLALIGVVLALAGPQWGEERVDTRPPHHDLVIVLDVSHSMRAEQPSRLERALRALEHLNQSVRKRGEVRLGLVLGAAYARLQLPPSQDYEHLDLLIDRVRQGDMPPELWVKFRTSAVSGTRLGAALKQAAKLKQSEQGRSFEILLISDGDDPVDDKEWLEGVQAARDARVPVHVLAIGDPERAHPLGDGPSTKLNEKVLQEIARRTDGAYIPAHTQTQIPLGSLMREIDTARRFQEALVTDAAPELMQPKPRHAWFYLGAAAFFTLALLLREGSPRKQLDVPPASSGIKPLATRLAALPLVLLMVSAAPPPDVDDWIKQGNVAFAREQYEEALALYEKAEGFTLDPGLLAFNKAAALYRLGRFHEAAAHYERCLEDKAAPAERRQKAYYDLGTALLSHSRSDADVLRGAVLALRSCLELAPADANLADDARFNLELAQRLWLVAMAKKKENSSESSEHEPKNGKKDEHTAKGGPKKDLKSGKGGDKTAAKIDGGTTGKLESGDKMPAPGSRLTLEHPEELRKLSSSAMQMLLLEEVERIASERQNDRRAAATKIRDVPNW